MARRSTGSPGAEAARVCRRRVWGRSGVRGLGYRNGLAIGPDICVRRWKQTSARYRNVVNTHPLLFLPPSSVVQILSEASHLQSCMINTILQYSSGVNTIYFLLFHLHTTVVSAQFIGHVIQGCPPGPESLMTLPDWMVLRQSGRAESSPNTIALGPGSHAQLLVSTTTA
jgi:hypothetical protein